MPVMPPAEGVTRAVMNFTTNGIKTANVLHFTQPPGPDAPPPEDLAAGLVTWWDVWVKPLLSINHILTSITATDLSSGAAPSTEYSTNLPKAGTVAGESLSGAACGVVSLQTGIRGRSFRGRIYVGGLAETHAAGNVLNSAWRTSITSAYDRLIIFASGPLVPDAALVVLSYYSGGALRGTPVATQVTTVSMDATIDTQRRRLR